MRLALPLLAFLLPLQAAAATLARQVVPSAPGAQRIDLDALAAGHVTSSDLRELRLFDAQGTEIPFLAISPSSGGELRQAARLVAPIPASEAQSGFEADFGEAVDARGLHVAGMPVPLMKRYRLDVSGDRRHWTTVVAEGTFFDLPEEGLRRMEAAFAETPVRFARVTWDDASSGRVPLPDVVELSVSSPRQEVSGLEVPLRIARRQEEPRTTRLTLELPGPNVPLRAVIVQVPKPRVQRAARVLSEPQLTGGRLEPALLGAGTLRRASRDGLVAEELSIALGSRPPTDRIELVIDDGDEAPLVVESVIGEIGPLPWIWFESPDGRALQATFDSGRAPARYDLEADRARIAASRPPRASWGERRGTGSTTPAPVTDGALPAGGPFDSTGYRFRRPVAMASGLVSLLLGAEVLATSPDLADLRIVTGDGLQVPYIVETRDEPLRLALPHLDVEPADPRVRGTTRHALALPSSGIPASRLVLTTSARVLEREVRVVEVMPGADRRSPARRVTLARAAWAASDAREPAQALVLELPRTSARSLTVEIDEGDNAPLPLDRPELLLPHRRLRFVHPGTALTLWFGAGGVQAPRYDMALLAPRLMAERATDVELAGGVAEIASGPARPGAASVALWTVLGATMLALAWLLARLLRGR